MLFEKSSGKPQTLYKSYLFPGQAMPLPDFEDQNITNLSKVTICPSKCQSWGEPNYLQKIKSELDTD